MKRVLVTGATGFVGANLAVRLLDLGYEVHASLRRDSDAWRLAAVHQDLRLHTLDVEDREGVAELIGLVRPEWIFHLAVYGAYSTQTDGRRMVTANVIGTMNLLEACLNTGFEVFVNTGSSSEYGVKEYGPTEEERLEPNSQYAVTKAAATHYCRYVARAQAARVPTLRLYSVFGPYEEPARLIPTLVAHALRRRLPPLVDPGIARDYIQVDDVVEAYIAVATNPCAELGPIFNVGTGTQTTLAEIVHLVRELFHVHEEPRWGEMRPREWDTHVWVADNRKIREQIGWQPRTSLAAGLEQFAAWLDGQSGPVQARYRLG